MTVVNRPALWLLLFLLGSSSAMMAQKTKSQLQKERQQNLDKIKETEKILTQTSNQKKTSLGELSALTQRIRQQEALILSIQTEIELMNMDIGENNEILRALQIDLTRLKDEYGAMIFSAQKTSTGVSKLMFLFSASTFDQLAMRLKYMEQYSAARREQAEAIRKVQEQLAEQVLVIEGKKEEKNKLLADELSEKNNLEALKKKKNSIIQSLSKQEIKLRKDLEETRKAVAKLEKLINDIIKEEMERAAREAAAAAKNKSKEASKNTAAVSALSANFEENKHKFPWPTSGFISQKFGRQNHPVLRGIVLQNDGVNIQTAEGERVKAIFAGEVRAVAFMPTLGSLVLINHGEYFTVYTGLKEVSVKKGQKVIAGQELGKVQVNSDGISELRFQIRKNTLALDPQDWLKE